MATRSMYTLFAWLTVAVLLFADLSTATAFAAGAAGTRFQATDARFFPQTGFRIDNDQFWDYFQHRGGIDTFGYPISRTFTFLGKPTQFFQRRVIEIEPNGTVGQLNILGSEILPFTSFNFATIPATDAALIASAPAVGSANYDTAVIAFIQQHVPNSFNGLPVNFLNTFQNTVSLSTAFPAGGGNPSLLFGFDLEMWGLPLSAPAADPHNSNFVFQRFQRGIMHFDNATRTTQGLLLGDYFKSIITGNNLPADLAREAAGSPFFRQYNNSEPNGLNNPGALPNTNMTNAFEPQAAAVAPPPTGNKFPLRYGFQAQMIGVNQQFVVNVTKNAGFGWLKQQIRWSDLEPSKGHILFDQIDPIVNTAAAAGVPLLFSVVTAPTWSRSGPGVDGPPNNNNDMADFVGALVARYGNKVPAYEIWNEQNFSREWGGQPINAGAYVDLLQTVYNRVKSINPSIIVVSGALTPTGFNDPNIAVDDTIYLTEMYQYKNGLFKHVADAVGAHMAGYNNPPQDFVDSHSFLAPCFTNTGQFTGSNFCFKTNGQFYFKRIDQLHNIMAAVGDNRPMWITEYEWGAATPPVPAGYEWTLGLTEDQVGNFFVQSIQMIQQSRPWVGAVFVWNLNFRMLADYHTNETALFGVLNPDGTARSIYNKLALMPK
ncbi:MAG TPA: hypothetical protein VNG11_08145 [Chloroflexota bacterium]|nr:hypothetical protein [Chloroflexota bacterium]